MNAHRTLTAAFLTATALMVGSAPASAMQAAEPGASTTERERGIVLECRGDLDGTAVYASLYENDTYGNWFQVVLGDPDAGNGRSKNVKRQILVDGKVRAAITIDGAKATVRGTASKARKKKHVHEELDDAGYHIVTDGTHRRLKNNLAFEYDGMATRLTCGPAFAFDLKVTKTPIV